MDQHRRGKPGLKAVSRKGRLVFHGALAAAGACGFFCFVFLYDDVSPMASVDFKVSRGEAFGIARAYLAGEILPARAGLCAGDRSPPQGNRGLTHGASFAVADRAAGP